MKQLSREEFEQHLKVLDQAKDVDTDEFFYTRLRGRMQHEDQRGGAFPLKPIWLIGCMVAFLLANAVTVFQEKKERKSEASSTIRDFASSYDQTISTPY
jgi:hypothetical protein